MDKLKQVLLLSRPRFWIYLAGPFIVGYSFAATNKAMLSDPKFFYLLFFFLIPANVFLYGVNDLFDKTTDQINPKKKKQEIKVNKQNIILYYVSIAVFFLSLTPVGFMINTKAGLSLVVFIGLAFFYSATPVRFKEKPFLDFASNILYLVPGIMGYVMLTNQWPPFFPLLLGFCWTSAMHIFSAIPDIQYDKKTGLNTTAVQLGKYPSLLVCGVFWFITAVGCFVLNHYLAVMFVYPLVAFLLFFKVSKNIEKAYWRFPIINLIVGSVLFVLAIYHLL